MMRRKRTDLTGDTKEIYTHLRLAAEGALVMRMHVFLIPGKAQKARKPSS